MKKYSKTQDWNIKERKHRHKASITKRSAPPPLNGAEPRRCRRSPGLPLTRKSGTAQAARMTPAQSGGKISHALRSRDVQNREHLVKGPPINKKNRKKICNTGKIMGKELTVPAQIFLFF